MSQIQKPWALILGGSSGFGLATAHKLGKEGFNLIIIHRDRRASMEKIEQEFESIRAQGAQLVSFNENALSLEGRTKIVEYIQNNIGKNSIKLLLHSIALGYLKEIVPQPSKPCATEKDFETTIYNMGTNLLSWVQDLFSSSLFTPQARVLGFTSEGNTVAWKGYAPVSAAKCTLEALIRAIAVEFAPYGITANTLQPGITDTPALRAIPGHEQMIESAQIRNPFKRLTTPTDVANVVYLMCRDEASWINGEIIRIDGGEKIG